MTQLKKFNDCVIAEYSSLEEADVGLDVLATDGFTSETVSRISFGEPESQSSIPREGVGTEKMTGAEEGSEAAASPAQGAEREMPELERSLPSTVKGNPQKSHQVDRAAGVGALMGGAIATPLAIGSLIGPFFVVGPILGLGIGAAVGGLFGAAERWGVRRDVAAEYEKKVRNGSVLVVVTDTPQRLHEAYKLLQTSGPLSIDRFRVPETEA